MLNLHTATAAELADELWMDFCFRATEDEAVSARDRLVAEGKELTNRTLIDNVVAHRVPVVGGPWVAITGVAATSGWPKGDADADRDITWADAPLHKRIAQAMGMDDYEAAQFYDLIGKGDY